MRTRGMFVPALVWAVLVVLAVHFLDFPGSVPDFRQASRGGTLLDATPAFTADGVYQRVDDYGAEGRRNYSFRNVTVDILLPLSVLPFLVLLMSKGINAVADKARASLLAIAVPVLMLAFNSLRHARPRQA